MPDQVNRTKIIPGISDHEIPYMELSVAPTYKKQVPRKVWLFNKADWHAMSDYLEPKLKLLNSGYNPCPDKLWNDFKELILDAMNLHIPRRMTKKRDCAPWVDKETKRMCDKRDSLYQKSRRKATVKAVQRFLRYKQTIKKQIRNCRTAYVHQLFTDSSKSKQELSKSFWTYVKHRRSQAISSVGPLKSRNTIATQSRDKAEILNKQFTSVFSKPSERLDYHQQTLHSKMKYIIVSEADVLKQL